MSMLSELHEAHKARQARMRPKAKPIVIVEPEPEAKPIPIPVIVIKTAPIEVSRDWIYIPPVDRNPSIDDVIRVVARYFRTTRIELLAHRRTAAIAFPRQIAMYLARTLTMQSLPKIGGRFADRDHTTIMHGHRKIAGLILTDAKVAQIVAELEAELTAKPIRARQSDHHPSIPIEEVAGLKGTGGCGADPDGEA